MYPISLFRDDPRPPFSPSGGDHEDLLPSEHSGVGANMLILIQYFSCRLLLKRPNLKNVDVFRASTLIVLGRKVHILFKVSGYLRLFYNFPAFITLITRLHCLHMLVHIYSRYPPTTSLVWD